MRHDESRLSRLIHTIHANMLWFLLATYAIAAVAPAPGLAIRDVSFGRVALLGESMRVTLPTLMLGFLLLNAGLGVKVSELKSLVRRPAALLAGLGGNLAVPLVFIFLVARFMGIWHNPDEVQNILVGLALVASMPIAGSSTAWSQNADGDLALSLGLVVGSTLLSPITTPVGLHAVGSLARGDYAEDLHELASSGSGVFLMMCVIIPTLLGLALRGAAGPRRLGVVMPWMKLTNTVNLLLLSYSNASAALPQAVADPDWDFLAVIFAITTALCVLAFGTGWLIARLLRADDSKRASLMYGLGMNNNGTGLVLATMALADHPRVMLPIIFYNLVQQVVAGSVGGIFRQADPADAVEPAEAAHLDPTNARPHHYATHSDHA